MLFARGTHAAFAVAVRLEREVFVAGTNQSEATETAVLGGHDEHAGAFDAVRLWRDRPRGADRVLDVDVFIDDAQITHALRDVELVAEEVLNL